MKNVLKLFVLASVLEFLPLSPAHAATYYVSPSGSDSSSGTSLSSPLRTIRQALNKAQASGDVVYVMAGTYAESVSVNQSGITLSAYQDQVPVIDGGTTLPGYDWGALLSINGNNNTIVGFEVKNSNTSGRYQGGYGIQIGGNHNIIRRMNSHHHFSNGVIVNGDYNTVEDSSVWQCARSNAANPGSAVWGSGMSAARNRSASALIPGITSYATIRRNKVFNNWGEGLSCYEADHCLIEDNIVYDNWTINFYLSDATNALVQRNIIYVSTAPAIPTRNNTHPPLLLADETASVPRSSGNTIINNFIFNTSFSAFGWTIVANSGLKNVLIANNTIVDGDMEIGGGAGSSVTHSNSQIRNNIILGRSSSVATTAGLTFSNNNWAVTPSLAGSSSDVVGDPRIARTGPTGPGALTGDYFKILAGSPVIDAAMPLTNVPEDFFKVSRGTKPDIGGHELSSSTSTTTPSPTPTPTPT
ncbi:MAG: right-handed parallel beta-helix repeat-containing protein, partial [Bdellovibrio sp.]